MQSPTDELVCSAGCKRTAKDDKDASEKGWEILPIQVRWRCPDCTRELYSVDERIREGYRSMV